MPILKIMTPYGDKYHVTEDGDICNVNKQTGAVVKPSGQWKMLGLQHVNRSEFIPFAQITPERLASVTLLYKNGHPQWTVRDLDHGTTRTWGNTVYHGVMCCYFDKEPVDASR